MEQDRNAYDLFPNCFGNGFLAALLLSHLM
jgi:hypothetical protein